MKYVVGLTGGIGSGKTVASEHFAALGVPVIDTDIIARTIVEPDQPALIELTNAFGDIILQEDGSLDRNALRVAAFSDNQSKAKLDAITHPAIRKETLTQLRDVTYPYCIVVVPLLTQNSPFNEFMQRILVVTAARDIKITRVEKRSGLSSDEVERIMATQLSDQERLDFSDDVIVNDGTIADVHSRVEELHETYLTLSAQI